MIVIGRRSASQTGFTIPYHIPCITGAITWWVWFGRPTVYQCLPSCRSEFEPTTRGLYQSLPPHRTHNTQWRDYVLCRVITIVLMWLRQALVWCRHLACMDGNRCPRMLGRQRWYGSGQGVSPGPWMLSHYRRQSTGFQALWLAWAWCRYTCMAYCLTSCSPLLCFNISIERQEVNVSFRVMMGAALHLTRSVSKRFSFFSDLVGKQFETHGGRFGRAMIKYPLYKKNNSRKNTPLYPGSRPCVLTVK